MVLFAISKDYMLPQHNIMVEICQRSWIRTCYSKHWSALYSEQCTTFDKIVITLIAEPIQYTFSENNIYLTNKKPLILYHSFREVMVLSRDLWNPLLHGNSILWSSETKIPRSIELQKFVNRISAITSLQLIE